MLLGMEETPQAQKVNKAIYKIFCAGWIKRKKKKISCGWICGILMIFFAPGMVTEQHVMLQEILRQKFQLIEGKKPCLEPTQGPFGWGMEKLEDRKWGVDRKVGNKRDFSFLMVQYKANFLRGALEKQMDPFGFLPR